MDIVKRFKLRSKQLADNESFAVLYQKIKDDENKKGYIKGIVKTIVLYTLQGFGGKETIERIMKDSFISLKKIHIYADSKDYDIIFKILQE